jgi:hypothetical protein
VEGGGEGSVWVGAEDSPALGGFAPTPADRQRFLDLLQQFRDANPVRGGISGISGKGKRGGQHTEFATTERPNNRCSSGCAGCSPVRR